MIEGVIRTRVGYAGGHKANPAYTNMGDHTETVQIDFDPKQISYDQLLETFWKSHNPRSGFWSRQYMNAVFYHNENQKKAAEASKTALAKKLGIKIKSKVAPLRSFTMAEDYHQKYLLKSNNRLEKEMELIYPHHRDFVASPAITRLNGYVGGNGNREQLSLDIDRLGLSSEGKKVLDALVR